MLLQFLVENHTCFRDETVLNLVVPDGADVPEHNVVPVPGVGRVLRVTAIYGANASGKSKLLEAMAWGARLATRGTEPKARMGQRPFRLDPRCATEPTRLQYDLLVDGLVVSYGLVFDDEKVIEEWLVADDEGAQDIQFSRPARDGRPAVVFSDLLAPTDTQQQLLGFIAGSTRPNQPLLAELLDRGAFEFEKVTLAMTQLAGARVGTERLWDTPSGAHLRRVIAGVPDYRHWLEGFVQRADPTIAGIEIRTAHGGLQAAVDASRTLWPQEWAHALGTAEIPFEVRFRVTARSGRTTMTFDELSDGTRRVIELASVWFPHPTDNDDLRVGLVDELDGSLHPNLSTLLVRHLLAGDATQTNQLVFTTHDTHLLNPALLGADAIRFVDKDVDGASHLHALSEFPPDQLTSLADRFGWGRAYLQGRFGGVPALRDWRDVPPLASEDPDG